MLKHLYSQTEQPNRTEQPNSCPHGVDGLISIVQRQERKMLGLTSIFLAFVLAKESVIEIWIVPH